MSVRVVERLGWWRRGASSAICADPGRMKSGDAQRDCDVRGSAAPADVRRNLRQSRTRGPADCLTRFAAAEICPVVASCLNGILLPN